MNLWNWLKDDLRDINTNPMNKPHKRRAQLLENLTHYITAFVIVLKGISKLDHPEKLGYSLVFILIGLALAAGTLFHHKFEHLIKNFKGYVFLLESIVMGIVGYLYLKEGKHYIQYACFFVSFAYLITLIIYLIKRKRMPAH